MVQRQVCILCGEACYWHGDYCERCYREKHVIDNHNHMALKAGLQGDLSLEQWLHTLEFFQWHCAYCGGVYQVLEHFIPARLHGGTTVTNCVPACRSCNDTKRNKHPDHVRHIPTIERIRVFLSLQNS
jgi:5-methylcytosine-specific restriction endonuclease McrA